MIIISTLDLKNYCEYHNIDISQLNFAPERCNYTVTHSINSYVSTASNTFKEFRVSPYTNIKHHLCIQNLSDSHKLLLSDDTWKQINTFKSFFLFVYLLLRLLWILFHTLCTLDPHRFENGRCH